MPPMELNRRDALKALAGMTAGLMTPGLLAQDAPSPAPSTRPTTQELMTPKTHDRFGDILPQRKLGKSGIYVTMLGAGGAHIGEMDEAEGQKTVETAIAGGIRIFDTASSYQRGGSETRYGKLLIPKYRDAIILIGKSTANTAQAAAADLEGSFKRLGTDYIDIWQMHTLSSAANAEQRVRNGVLDFMLKAKQQGKIRYIGFSGHRRCESHVRILQLAKEKGVRFDTCQMPVNVVESGYASYMQEAMPMALEQGTAIVAMKTLANGGFFGRGASVSQPAPEKTVTLIPGRLSIAEATNFAWSLPVSTIISGMDNAAQLQEKIDLAKRFTAMSEQTRLELVARLADAAGRVAEPYKE